MVAPDFSAFVGTLTRGESINPARLDLMSAIDRIAQEHLRSEWTSIPLDKRIELLTLALEVSHDEATVNFDQLALIALQDGSPDVRRAAVELTWESTEPEIATVLVGLLKNDRSPIVRAEAASVLGNYVLEREFEQMDEVEGDHLVDTLHAITVDENEPDEVRVAALLSLSPRTLQWVTDLITDFYYDESRILRLAAVAAMGITVSEEWLEYLEEQLQSDDADFRAAAVTSVGEIADEGTIEMVQALLVDESETVVMAAVEALGAIGGPDAVAILEAFQEQSEPELFDVIEVSIELARDGVNRIAPLLEKILDDDDD